MLAAGGIALFELDRRGQQFGRAIEEVKERAFVENTRGALERDPTITGAERVSKYILTDILNDPAKTPLKLALLKDLLSAKMTTIPADYGLDSSLRRLAQKPNMEVHYKLHYSKIRHDFPVDEFQFVWESLARDVASLWGLPVPLNLKPEADPALPKDRMVIVRMSDGKIIFETDSSPTVDNDHILAWAPNVRRAPGIEEFFNTFRAEWREITWLKHGGPYYAVPRWSLPVWKAGEVPAYARGSGTALFLSDALIHAPASLLDGAAVDMLLERIVGEHPHAVAEVKMARGKRLGEDFAQIVKQGTSLTSLPEIIDALAHAAEESSNEAATSVIRSWTEALPARLRGPWPNPAESLEGETRSPSSGKARQVDAAEDGLLAANQKRRRAALSAIEPHLGAPPRPLRVYLGVNTEKVFVAEGSDALSRSAATRIEDMRERIFRRYGLRLPALRFSLDDNFKGNEFSVEFLTTATKPRVITIDALAVPPKVVEHVLAEVEQVYVQYMDLFVTADTVHSLLKTQVRPGVAAWLQNRYSLTDLKVLVRSFIRGQQKLSSSTNVLRHPDWLLGSLVFWALVEDPLDGAAVTAHLLELARSLETGSSRSRAPGPLAQSIEKGIEALTGDNADSAKEAFAQAVAIDRTEAIAVFLTKYKAALPGSVLARFKVACKAPPLLYGNRLELESFLYDGSSLGGSGLQAHLRRSLGLCALRSRTDDQNREAWVKRARQLIIEDADANAWSPDDALWISQRMMKLFSPLTDPMSDMAQAERLLQRALSGKKRSEKLEEISRSADSCRERPDHFRCYAALAKLASDVSCPECALGPATYLVQSERADHLKMARAAVDAFEVARSNDAGFAAETEQYLKTAVWVRMGAEIRALQYTGSISTEIIDTLRTAAKADPLLNIDLVQLLIATSRHREAAEQIGDALAKAPKDITFINLDYVLKASTGRLSASDDRLNGLPALNKCQGTYSGDPCSGTWHAAAIWQVLTKTGPWEETAQRFLLYSNHPYRNLVAVMLSASLGMESGLAREILRRQWRQVDPSEFRARMVWADGQVWYDMILAHFIRPSLGCDSKDGDEAVGFA